MATFPKSLEKNFLVSSVVEATGVHTGQLTPFQLGLFDSQYYKSVGTSIPANVLLAVGSAHTGQRKVPGKLGNFANANSVNRSYKSPVIDTRLGSIKEAKLIKAQTVNQQPIGYLGYDGVNYCGGMQFECDTAYFVEVEVVGQPVRAMFGRDLCEIITVTTDPCDSCATGCDTKDMKEKYLTELIRQINVENLFLNRFVKASKIIKHCPVPAALSKTNFTKYQMTLCDDGSAMALARIQAKYPLAKVKRVKREEAFSTYETDYLTSAPANYVSQPIELQDCNTCPAGSTAVPSRLVYRVTIDNDGSDVTPSQALTAVQAKYATAVAAEKIDFKYGTATYVVQFPSNFTVPGTIPTETTIEYVGKTDAYCLIPSSTFSWTAAGTAYKITRKLRTTIQDPTCDDILVKLQAFYATDSNIVPNSVVAASTPVSDDCKTVYELEQYSNLLTDGCDWVAEATFPPVQPYQGFMWNVDLCDGWTLNGNGCPVPPADPTEEFVAGIRFDVIYDEELQDSPAYSIYDNLNREAIYIRASFGKFNSKERVVLKDAVPWKQTQFYKRESNRGHSVIRQVIETGFYEGEVYYDHAMVAEAYKLIEAEGLKYGIDKNKFYNSVELTFNSATVTGMHQPDNRLWKYRFYYDKDDAVLEGKILSMVNKLLNKADLPLLS